MKTPPGGYRIEMSDAAKILIERGRAAWQMIRRDESWEKWVEIGKALDQGRREIMRALHTNNPRGRAWSTVFGDWLVESGFDEVDAGVRSRLQKLIDNLPAVEAWRQTLGLAQRLEYNHPNTVWRRFEKRALVPQKDDPVALKPTNPKDVEIARLVEEVDEATAKIRRLERAAGDISEGRDWSWHDDPADIAQAMMRLYPDKAKRLGAALQNLAKPAVKKPRKPAAIVLDLP